jgi:hypothetical protein
MSAGKNKAESSAVRASQNQPADLDDVSCERSWPGSGGSDATTTRPEPDRQMKKRAR